MRGLVFGMFGEWSQDVVRLLKLAASKLATRWAALNGLSADDALQACTWDLKRRWALTALRANARVRIECAHHVTYSAAGSPSSQCAPRWLGRLTLAGSPADLARNRYSGPPVLQHERLT